jgi:translocation and assembly module TamA
MTGRARGAQARGSAAAGRPAGLLAAGLAALLAGLLTSGCASVQAPAGAAATPAAAAGEGFSLLTEQEFEQQSPTLGVRLEIDAPAELKTLLERHLDLVRLGTMADDDIDDTEWARLIDASPNQVRELLQTEGYFAPRVRIERTPGRGSNERDLVRLSVEPGPRAKISRVTIEAEGELERAASAGDGYGAEALAALRKGWELPAGSEFRNTRWADAKAAALSRLRSAGYAAATWVGTGAAVDVEKNEVRLFLVADSGPLFRLGPIQIEGLVAQDAETVRNLAYSRGGVPVTETFLLDFQERLQKSGLFETVAVTVEPDVTQAAAAPVTVRVRETPLQSYTFGVGVSANTGARFSVAQQLRRPFGLPLSSSLKIEVGEKRQAWEGEISTRTDERLYRNLVGAAVERLRSDDDVVLSQRVRLGRTQDTQRIERLGFVEWERSSRRTDAGDRADAVAVSLNFHGGWRDLDSVVLPTTGETLTAQVGVGRSHGTDAKTGTFGRTYGRLTVYRPLGQTLYAQARLELGRVFLEPGMVVPESLRWRAGGDESVRGYSYRSLGPVVDGAVGSGETILTSSIEIARPLLASMPSLWGAVFVDGGNAATSFGQLDPVYGYGFGVRWRSPVGPLRIDLAWPERERQPRLHFSIGIAF